MGATGPTVHEIFVPGRLCLFGEHSDWAGSHCRREIAGLLCHAVHRSIRTAQCYIPLHCASVASFLQG
jgi:hypothetical protein